MQGKGSSLNKVRFQLKMEAAVWNVLWMPRQLRQESAEAKAERIVAEELRRLKWLESDLAFRRKSDPAKLGIAARLRRETTLSIKTIASRVHLGASKSANTRLHTAMGRGISGQTAQATFGRRKETTHVKA